MKEDIQQLIANGQTKEALALLVKMQPDALLLQAQYTNGEKQFNLGLIDFTEWQRIQARVNFAALEMAGKAKIEVPGHTHTPSPAHATSTGTGHGTGTGTGTGTTGTGAGTHRKVFISYNHGDKEVARRVCTFLETNGLDVILDQDDMAAGRSIMEFIQESIKTCNAVVSIVSSKSLQSGWVGQESVASIYAVWLADKKFIPVALDAVAFDSKFQITALRSINEKIQELDKDITEIRGLGSDARDLEDDRKRLFDLQKEFSTILQRLKSVLMIPIDGDNFDGGMKKVLSAIQNI